MMIEDIEVIGTKRFLSTAADVAGAEKALGTRFPTHYRDYVTKLGEGTLGGTWVRVYPPRRILAGLNSVGEWRDRLREYWFWDENPYIATDTVGDCVIIGDTVGGDEFCFDKRDPDRIIILPRDTEQVHVVDGGLLTAIEWLCASGVLTEKFDERRFEPFDSRQGEG